MMPLWHEKRSQVVLRILLKNQSLDTKDSNNRGYYPLYDDGVTPLFQNIKSQYNEGYYFSYDGVMPFNVEVLLKNQILDMKNPNNRKYTFYYEGDYLPKALLKKTFFLRDSNLIKLKTIALK